MPRGDYWERYEVERATEVRELQLAARQSLDTWMPTVRPWDCWMTGTYDQTGHRRGVEKIMGAEVHKRVSPKTALWDAQDFLNRASRLVGHDVDGVFAAEPHLDGSYHLHGLLALGDDRRSIRFALKWQWRVTHGVCQFRAVADASPAARYLTKYMLKYGVEVAFLQGTYGA